MLRKIHFIIIIAAVFTLLARAATSWACAVCFGSDGDPTTDGFNASVLFLLSTPYLVVGSIVGGLVFAYRRSLKKRETADTGEPIIPLGLHQEDAHR
jgi:hypothetical protein